MKNFNIESFEILSVSYVERPNAIYQFIKRGFSVEEIVITRINASNYHMFASTILNF